MCFGCALTHRVIEQFVHDLFQLRSGTGNGVVAEDAADWVVNMPQDCAHVWHTTFSFDDCLQSTLIIG
jgi:hypothetical protein